MMMVLALKLVLLPFLFFGSWAKGEDDFCEPSRERTVDQLHCHVNNPVGQQVIMEEFHLVRRCRRKTAEEAQTDGNCGKNRYNFVLPYDDTRVILSDGGSTYINANYINGIEKKKEYIGTQAPLANTVGDFWRMIWQEGTTRIVTLANIIEEGEIKMHKYWPESKEEFGGIKVSLQNETAESSCDCTIRTFLISKDGTSRKVKQFHYTGWPDMGIPTHQERFVEFLKSIRAYNPDDKAPIVVHCSAGVGRTGTFILTDSIWQQAKKNENVDFIERLRDIRQARYWLVADEGQYLFAHKVVHDLLHPDESRIEVTCPKFFQCPQTKI